MSQMKMNYYDEVENYIIDNKITKTVKNYSIRKSNLTTYFNVGKLLVEAENYYGKAMEKEYSDMLIKELDNKYNINNLLEMKKLYLFTKKHLLDIQLAISHYRILFTLSDCNEIDYYINQVKLRRLSAREFKNIIKNNEYKNLFK